MCSKNFIADRYKKIMHVNSKKWFEIFSVAKFGVRKKIKSGQGFFTFLCVELLRYHLKEIRDIVG